MKFRNPLSRAKRTPATTRSLSETRRLLVEEINARGGISAAEKRHMCEIIDATVALATQPGKSHQEHHEAFRKALVARQRESGKLRPMWLAFKKMVAGKSTQAQIDAAISKTFKDEEQMRKALSSLHASIILRHFEKVCPSSVRSQTRGRHLEPQFA